MPDDSRRALVSQLADDLGWLEEHARRQSGSARAGVRLRLAAALVRNAIGPFLNDQPAEPLHVAVIGGAGAGKSTVANFLSGAPLAETNPQAGFTRHPVAFAAADGPPAWTGHLGFLGPLQRLVEATPSSLDEDVYQLRAVPEGASGALLDRFVVWDCPDVTTWAAEGYISRMLEVAGLADVVVYVASDERYNDEIPTQFLRLLLEAGKPVVACLTKMREADASQIIEHFRQEVLGQIPGSAVPCLAIPQLTPEQLADPARQAGKHRIPLVNQVGVLGEPPGAARLRTVRWAAAYLAAAVPELLGVARRDVAALEDWRRTVQAGRREFEERYRREYLGGEKFRRFDEALVRLLDLLEIPGAGQVLSTTLWVLRLPYRFVKGLLAKTMARPEPPAVPEQPILEAALAGWLDLLRKEAARRGETHPVWAHVEHGFQTGLAEAAREEFQRDFRGFQLGLADEVDRTARAIYEDLEKSPAVLNTLRGGKLAVDVAAVVAAAVTAGAHWGLDFILVPLAASVSHQLVELLGRQYVDNQRDLARLRQQDLVARHLSGPLAEWLERWPMTGGSTYERLHRILQRLPSAVAQLSQTVEQAAARQPTPGSRKMAV